MERSAVTRLSRRCNAQRQISGEPWSRIDAINLLRREHNLGVLDAVIEAGRLRLRPILMTTSTTVLGLFPLALGFGPGAEIQAALARVVVGGLVASTLVTLFLIPVSYVTTSALMERVREPGWTFPGRRATCTRVVKPSALSNP